MNRRAIIPIALLAFGATAFAQNTAVFWSAFDQGFAMPQSSSTMVKSVAGQAFVGFAQSSTMRHEAGFLADTLLRGGGSGTGVIVYSRTGSSRPSVWMRATDGSFDTMVVDSAAWPRLSHNGRYILFHKTTSGNPTYNTNMSFYDLQTRRDTLLFATGDYLVSYDWFSDDYHIAFDQVCSMMMMNRDRTGITTLYSASCYDDAPVVRPGMWAIAHHNNQGLVVTDSLGSNRRQIPNTQGGDYWPSWSPDGQWLAFFRIVNDTVWNYYKIHPDGSGLTALTSFTTTQAVFYNGGAWTPDGSKIIVAGSINRVRGLYAIATDGSRGKALLPGTAGIPVDFVGNVTGNINITLTDVHDEKQPQAMPTQYRLGQNYPNPFNPATTIEYDLPSASRVELRLYDILGREVTTLVNEVQAAGYHSVRFDASGLASGVYLYRLRAGEFTQTKRMMLLR
jgi:hypothetical protein